MKLLEPKAIKSEFNKPAITRELYNKILEERIDQILKVSRGISYGNLVYDFKGPTPSINFAIFGGPMGTYNQLKNGDKTLQQVEKEQEDFWKYLNEIVAGNPKHKSEKQSYVIKNVKNLYNSRQKIIDLLDDNARIRSEAIYKSKQDKTEGAGLKILTLKQMLQRLPIDLAQVKAGNNSESLLN